MNNNQEIEKIADIASKWWADRVTSPRFDNGDNSVEGMFTSALASLGTKDITATKIQSFTKDLYLDIVKRLSNLSDNMSIIYSCDYGPDMTLKNIAQLSDIPDSNFPWKTTMWIYKDACMVRYGYGSDIDYLYDSITYWQRKLDDNEKSIKYWEEKGEPEIVQSHIEEKQYIKDNLKRCLNKK